MIFNIFFLKPELFYWDYFPVRVASGDEKGFCYIYNIFKPLSEGNIRNLDSFWGVWK